MIIETEAFVFFTLTNEGLSVPKREEMTGKLKEGKRKFSKKRLVLAVAIVLLVFTIIFVYKVNCNITNILRGLIRAWAFLKVPFKTPAGLNEDKKKAG
jgi:hypothetical protein